MGVKTLQTVMIKEKVKNIIDMLIKKGIYKRFKIMS
jgi:hypothetical protein